MKDELKLRYSRLIAVEEIGREGVEKLMESRVLVAGCGALGSMAAMQLAGSGVGHIRIADFDTIDISNLQRQFFYQTSEAGYRKADILASRIADLNPSVDVEVLNCMIGRENAMDIVGGCDFVVEATDNHASMLLIDRICEEQGIACTLAGISEFGGQVMTCLPGGSRYRDIFPDAGGDEGIMPCSMAGVFGPAAAVAASIEAAEAVKYITGAGQSLAERMLVFNLADMRFDVFQI